jgi:hypothetical protein
VVALVAAEAVTPALFPKVMVRLERLVREMLEDQESLEAQTQGVEEAAEPEKQETPMARLMVAMVFRRRLPEQQ